MRIVQEFYCSGNPGSACPGYFRVTLNLAINARVLIECPQCKRQHERDIHNGQIQDCTKQQQTTIIITAMPSTWSKTPALHHSQRHMRHGAILTDPTRDLIDDRWAELYGDRI